jgi:molybdopterin/thiamine biosynthesis adenylyltransferase
MTDDLDEGELETYAWQTDLPGFGEAGQRALKGATVVVSRAGGVGGLAAFQLAAAGVGHLVIAHGGVVKRSDLHRQLLQTAAQVGRPRSESMRERLTALNPRCRVTVVNAHADEGNADALVAQADAVVGAAPLFAERFALNAACVRRGVPLVDAAMFGMECQVATILPGRTPCLRCWCGEAPPDWKRRFPVLGAVSGTAGCIAAVEVVKLLTGVGTPLAGWMLRLDLGSGQARRLRLARDPACPVCAGRWIGVATDPLPPAPLIR